MFKPNKYLGIDIGTETVKLVELKKEGDKNILNTYGMLRIGSGGVANQEGGKEGVDIFKMNEKQLSDILKQLIASSRATAKDAIFSIPVFSSFITLIDLPMMSEDELAASIPFEARKYIPVPVEEVQFSWSVVEKAGAGNAGNVSAPNIPGGAGATGATGQMQVLLVAVPNEVIGKYKNIANNLGINAQFEIETFSLARSLSGQITQSGGGVAIIADIGAKSTEICIVDNGLLRMSHNFEASGANITKSISSKAGLDIEKSEKIKTEKGLRVSPEDKAIYDSILPLLDMIIFEIERTSSSYQQKTGRRAQKVVLSGGTANLPGLVDYMAQHLGIAVTIADPFSGISFPPPLRGVLQNIGPSFSVAVGLAERNLV